MHWIAKYVVKFSTPGSYFKYVQSSVTLLTHQKSSNFIFYQNKYRLNIALFPVGKSDSDD